MSLKTFQNSILIKICLIALILSINGCAQKQIDSGKVVVPKQLFWIPPVSVEQKPQTQDEVALFMLEIYEAYEKCAINIKSIEKILDTQDRG